MGAQETPIGYEPNPADINIDGLDDVTQDTLVELLKVDPQLWRQEVDGIKEFYGKFGDRLPEELKHQLSILEENLK